MADEAGVVEQPAESKELDRAEKDFDEIIEHLKSSISRERKIARSFGCLAILASLGGLALLYFLSKWGLETIQETAETQNSQALTATTIYLLVRGSAYAGVVAGLLYAIVSLARAALDQATRFDKRLIAALFIDFAVHAQHVDVEKMRLAMSVLEAWGASVESAYTPAKVAAKRAESLKASVGKDGGTVEHSSTSEG